MHRASVNQNAKAAPTSVIVIPAPTGEASKRSKKRLPLAEKPHIPDLFSLLPETDKQEHRQA